MKNKKIFAALIILAAFALVFSSCTFKMNSDQQIIYDDFIKSVKEGAEMMEIPADELAAGLAIQNAIAITKGFEIQDTTPDKPVAKGTKEDALKKRFVAKKKK